MHKTVLKTTLPILALLGVLLWCGSCRKDFEYAASNGKLSFSRDTVFLDTVFNNIGSSTYALTVYNNGRDDISIPSVRLQRGTSSFYRLNVDGEAGQRFQNVPIRARDSLFIFIETTVSLGENPENSLLYTDALVFDSGDLEQQVQLVTLVKDAVFLYPRRNPDGSEESVLLAADQEGNATRVPGFLLADDELRFTNEKPYVIYGYAAVGATKKLIIDAGARIHFHTDSGLLVQDGGSIAINGKLSEDQELLEGEVIFEGDRLEPAFAEISGQWGIFWLARGSVNNTIEYLTVKNGTVGLFVEGDGDLQSPTVQLSNTRLFNNANHNLWASNAHIVGSNLVLGGAGASSLYLSHGGNYSFTHATVANFWNRGFRGGTALEISNAGPLGGSGGLGGDLERASFRNCIIDGNSPFELLLTQNGDRSFRYDFSHCLIKFNDFSNQFEDNPLYDFLDTSRYTNVRLQFDSDFRFPARNDFRIGPTSDAVEGASARFSQEVPLDILGIERQPNPHLGSYQATGQNDM